MQIYVIGRGRAILSCSVEGQTDWEASKQQWSLDKRLVRGGLKAAPSQVRLEITAGNDQDASAK